MSNYKFLHEKKTVSESLEIPKDRNLEILKKCQIAFIECDSASGILEYALNALKPDNIVEAAYIGFVMKTVIEMEGKKSLAHAFADIFLKQS